MAMGIRDTKELTYRHADADIIPSSIDVPIQRIKLFDLGLLALYLNFKKVHINVPERHFEAVGDFGTITTLKNELGKYIHFEGDILSINDQITKGLAFVNIMSQSSVTGRLTFGPGLSSNGIFLPLQLLPNAVADGWNEERFKLAHRILVLGIRGQDGLAKGQIAAEASLFGELYENRGRNSTAQELSERWPDRGSEAKRSSSSPTRTANVSLSTGGCVCGTRL